MNIKTKKQIERYAKSFRWTPANFYWKHALLVRKFCIFIQKNVGGDVDVVETAGILHDIGKARLLAPGHEEISAELAEKFLKKIKFDRYKIKKIIDCIKYVDFSSLEAKILRTADSMSLIMDTSGGKEWYFKNVFQNNCNRVLNELRKSYSEVEFDFAKEFIKKRYKKLLIKYRI